MATSKNPHCDSDTEDNDKVVEIEPDCPPSEASFKVADSLSHINLDNTKAESDLEVDSSFSRSGRHVCTTQTEDIQCISSTENEKADETQISVGLSTETKEDVAEPSQPAEDTKDLECHNVTPEPLCERTLCPAAFITQNTDGDTYIHLAIIQKNPGVACQIIDLATSVQDLNILNHLYQSALYLAVLENQFRVVRKLVVCGAKIDQRDRRGYTALHLACEKGFFHCLLALTYPITEEERAEVPANYHVPPQQIPQDLTILTYAGWSCLHLLVQHKPIKYIDCINYLVKCGADVNLEAGKSGRTILHLAAESYDVELTRFLITNPAVNLIATTWADQTAYHLAAGRGHHDIEELFEEAGAAKDETCEMDVPQ